MNTESFRQRLGPSAGMRPIRIGRSDQRGQLHFTRLQRLRAGSIAKTGQKQQSVHFPGDQLPRGFGQGQVF